MTRQTEWFYRFTASIEYNIRIRYSQVFAKATIIFDLAHVRPMERICVAHELSYGAASIYPTFSLFRVPEFQAFSVSGFPFPRVSKVHRLRD